MENKKDNRIICGDCLDILKTLPENSVDSICCDPPYELGFMGKSWDNSGIAYNVEMWKECLRVLKPGGHLLAFGGARTYHRMAVAIEDAGFEVRDMIEWVYGSGFPKSLNIGKAVDKIQGNEREVLGKNSDFSRDGAKRNGLEHQTVKEVGQKIGHEYGFGSAWESEVTKGTSEWEGWGTALKPAHEPICMARKPLAEKTVAENVLKYGTGGINIDGCRVETNGEKLDVGGRGKHDRGEGYGFKPMKDFEIPEGQGRFPANLIHDNSEEVRECFPEAKGWSSQKHNNFNPYGGNAFNKSETTRDGYHEGFNDSGNASRFFKSIIYQAKASKAERNRGCEGLEDKIGGSMCANTGNTMDLGGASLKGEKKQIQNTKNNHPTVKPIALMEYLIKMVTPKGGIVLDPFAGSGSTLVAAKQNGFQYIGIELTEEYIPIIEARLNALNQDKLL